MAIAATTAPAEPYAHGFGAEANERRSFRLPDLTPQPPSYENSLERASSERPAFALNPVHDWGGSAPQYPRERSERSCRSDQLANILTDSTVADAAKSRGGAKTLTELLDTATALRSTSEDRETPGTRLSTEDMDLVDGIIVTLCRAARNAAKQAAMETARPALLADFALPHITEAREQSAPAAGTTPATP